MKKSGGRKLEECHLMDEKFGDSRAVDDRRFERLRPLKIPHDYDGGQTHDANGQDVHAAVVTAHGYISV